MLLLSQVAQHGLSKKDQLEIDALLVPNAMARDGAAPGDGAKEPPDQPRMPTTDTMRDQLVTSATSTIQTRTTCATATEPAVHMVGARELPDLNYLTKVSIL